MERIKAYQRREERGTLVVDVLRHYLQSLPACSLRHGAVPRLKDHSEGLVSKSC